ncbi:MAG: HEAT repeat domain-containing protein [Spirochaetia bacterium]|jgi:HEAT repeat protein|nr:HEAT repeat domain-containing protein [Spirochaetia bacterium]
MKKTALVLVLLFPLYLIFPQDSDDASALRKAREDKLSYGLNSEISDLIKELTEDKDSSYNGKLSELFVKTKNTGIQKDLLNFFTVMESDLLLDEAVKKIENRNYENKAVVISSIKYVSLIGKNTNENLFTELLDDNEDDYRIEAVKVLCETGDRKYTSKLIEIYEKEESEAVKLQIILDIGKLKDTSSSQFLIDIASDREIERTYRQYAINSLGQIADDSSFDFLLSAYGENDPYIRIYALSAVSKYDRKEVDTIILESLKDENWRIRKEAAISAGSKKDSSFDDILIYRIENDPEENIRLEALKALAEIGSMEGMNYIRSKAEDPRSSFKIRKLAFVLSVSKNVSDSIKMIDRVLEKEWNSPNKTLIENFCSELSKVKDSSLGVFYEKMLGHSSVVVKISGIKGIRLNKIGTLKEKIKTISEDKSQSLSVRNNALAALENL